MGKIIGIDLGTTNSCVAIMEGGKPRVIENSEGDRTTPSIVAFTKDDEVVVGQSAKRQAVTNPHNTLFAVKRLIGRRFKMSGAERHQHGGLQIERLTMVMPGLTSTARKCPRRNFGARAHEDEKDSEDSSAALTEAVITVPAYFNDSQRQATKERAASRGGR